ncbi:hypothetical protein D0Z00_000578 [Geotrichum galactomycetum]|uniref:Uncharacterized protein n=1 Tax=Geotrichum galactomycetum TaxID=27317 RepID=A0ACB6V991_9ASCO|nr:hypothetical protein D0Z00_000578 [Geotrichum candidum]
MLFSDSVLKSAASLLFLAASAHAQCSQISGNYYCNKVNQVVYENIGFSGSYNEVTNFDTSSCSCSSKPVSFSGSLSPLDQEVSLHFRGPLNLKQFAYYSYNNTKTKRDVSEEHTVAKRHAHHAHKRDAVYVTKVVEAGAAATTSTAAKQAASSAASANKQTTQAGTGWTRQSYYNAASQSSTGLVFLNHMGGTAGSGIWDACFGNSLSYCAADGISGAGSPQILADTVIPSNKEFSIFTSEKCEGDSCGYYRPGSTAYHGFDGNYKAFAFEFSMPSDTGSTAVINGDMPAIWMLNAQIPRTLQYGNGACSCWSTGCGEFDIFEVLNSGNQFLTSHLHSGQGAAALSNNGGGGTSDYVARPVSGTLKAAVIFADASITLTVLDDKTTFDQFLSDDAMAKWIAQSASSSSSVSF